MTRAAPKSVARQGILLMITAVFFLAGLDATAKYLMQSYDVVQVLWVRYAGQTVIVMLVLGRNLPQALKTAHPGLQLVRSLFLFVATTFFFLGVANIDLAAAVAVLQVNPLIVTVGAYLVLGERFGWRRLLGVVGGLAGALVVIRPGSSVFSPYALLPLLAAASYASYAISTRLLSRDESVWTNLFYTTAVGCILATVAVPFFWKTPDIEGIALMAMAGVLATIGQYFIIRSLFAAEASVVAPFGYASLVFAAILGVIVFGEVPDPWTCVGALMIVGSGVYVWHRESVKAKVR